MSHAEPSYHAEVGARSSRKVKSKPPTAAHRTGRMALPASPLGLDDAAGTAGRSKGGLQTLRILAGALRWSADCLGPEERRLRHGTRQRAHGGLHQGPAQTAL